MGRQDSAFMTRQGNNFQVADDVFTTCSALNIWEGNETVCMKVSERDRNWEREHLFVDVPNWTTPPRNHVDTPPYQIIMAAGSQALARDGRLRLQLGILNTPIAGVSVTRFLGVEKEKERRNKDDSACDSRTFNWLLTKKILPWTPCSFLSISLQNNWVGVQFGGVLIGVAPGVIGRVPLPGFPYRVSEIGTLESWAALQALTLQTHPRFASWLQATTFRPERETLGAV